MDEVPYSEVLALAIAMADAEGFDWPYMSEGKESDLSPKDQGWWIRIAEKAFDHLQRRAEENRGHGAGKSFGHITAF